MASKFNTVSKLKEGNSEHLYWGSSPEAGQGWDFSGTANSGNGQSGIKLEAELVGN